MKRFEQVLRIWIIILIVSVCHSHAVIAVDTEDKNYIETDSLSYGLDTIHTYKHRTSGLNIIWIENDDNNLSFTLGVKTPTTDSTGVNHIIEHTLFTGSKKYPSSTLFFDASAQYPTLFMNALTSADLTLFPFSTPYKDCYNHLLDLYMDAVFNPNMLNQAYSFYEESFYYNTTTQSYGGVVYNEMKGANADIGRNIYKALRKGFYENTHYANDSGGAVEEIPALTYEDFIQTYKRYYYPNNMMIVLYGNIDIEGTLEDIHHYVKSYTLTDQWVNVNVPFHKTTQPLEVCYVSNQDKVVIIKGFLLDNTATLEEELSLDLWMQTYWAKSDSALKERLKSLGIDQVEIIKDDGTQHSIYAIVVKDVPVSDKDKTTALLETAIQQTLQQRDLSAEEETLKRAKFNMKDTHNQQLKGIDIADEYISNWAHESIDHKYYEEINVFKQIDSINSGIEKMFEDKIYQRTIYLEPIQKIEESPLSKSPIDKNDWTEINEKMWAWQKENSNQALPPINPKQMLLEVDFPKVKKTSDGKYLFTPIESELFQTQIYIPIDHINQEDLPSLFLYGEILNGVAKEYKPFDGKITTKIISIDQKDGQTANYLNIHFMTQENKDVTVIYDNLINQLHSKSEEWYSKILKNYNITLKQQMQTDVLATLKRLNGAGQTGAKRYQYEKFYPIYHLLKQSSSEELKLLGEKAVQLGEQIGLNADTVIGLSGTEKSIASHQQSWKKYIREHKIESPAYNNYNFIRKDALNIYHQNTPVDYIVGTYDKENDWVDGTDYVLASYATHRYLQPLIRVEKGAYGAGMYAIYPNTLSFYTYRDPDYRTSLKTIQQLASALKNNLSEDGVEEVKVESLSSLQKQLKLLGTPFEKSSNMEQLVLAGVKEHDIEVLQKDILNATVPKLQEKLVLLEYMIPKSQVGVCTKKSTVESESCSNNYEVD